MDLRTLFRRDNVRLVAVATAFAAIGLSAPAVSQDVRTQLGLNADKVDGKDAVGYSATGSQRKGKLVATHPRTGKLPSGAMAKAPDSSRLAGASSSAYTTRKAKPGEVQTGVYSVSGSGSGTWMATSVQFSSALPASLGPSQMAFMTMGGAYTTTCPGPGRVGPRGQLCVYETAGSGRTSPAAYDPATGQTGAARTGSMIGMFATSDAYSYGTWAVKAP